MGISKRPDIWMKSTAYLEAKGCYIKQYGNIKMYLRLTGYANSRCKKSVHT